MKKLFELNEKDLEMISGGGIMGDIVCGIKLGLPGSVPVVLYANNEPISGTVACGITNVVSYVALMGAGAGLLKVWQNLHGKKTK